MQYVVKWPLGLVLLVLISICRGEDDDYNVVHKDGSFEFGYKTPDSYHYADGNRANVVRGEFGSKNPATGAIDSTVYTAGPRGYRPRGKNVVRKYDLNQNGPRPIGSRDDPYFDPREDPSYSFSFRTRTYNREENANRVGDISGKYSYVDDVGERHNVEFISGKNIGFHVKTPYPDSNPRAYGPLYFRGRGKPIPRGRTSIQRGLDGSYRFVSAGPDQRRTETSDATGHVRGSYTYLDDKGVQHSVHYIAGPETGYRVLKNVKGPHLPTVFPFGRPEIIPPDFYDYIKDTGDVFDTAATGAVKPINNNIGGGGSGSGGGGGGGGGGGSGGGGGGGGGKKPGSTFGGGGGSKPNYDDDGSDSDDFAGDLFGGGGGGDGGGGGGSSGSGGGSSGSIGGSSIGTGGSSGTRPGSRPSGDDGDDGSYKPGLDESGLGFGGSSGSSGNLPRPIQRPSKPSRPTYDYDDNEDVNDNFGLFGSESGRPQYPGGVGGSSDSSSGSSGTPGGTLQITGTSSGSGGISGSDACRNCQGTIVTNVGDKIFSVPPGISVRAHVQAIDLLPLASKVPSPSEQFLADMSIRTEQLNSAASDIVNNTMRISDTTILSTTTATTDISTVEPTTEGTTITTTTTGRVPTTMTSTVRSTTTTTRHSILNDKDDEDDEDTTIF